MVSPVYTAVSSVILSRHLEQVTDTDTQPGLFLLSKPCVFSEAQDVLLNERRRVEAWLCWCLIHRVSLGGLTLTNKSIQYQRTCSTDVITDYQETNRPVIVCCVSSYNNLVNFRSTETHYALCYAMMSCFMLLSVKVWNGLPRTWGKCAGGKKKGFSLNFYWQTSKWWRPV